MKKGHRAFAYSIVILLLLGVLIFLLHRCYRNLLEPLKAMASMQAESAASDIMNEAMKQALAAYTGTSEDFVIYYTDAQGNITAYGIDTMAVGNLSTTVLDAMNQVFEEIGDITVYIPMGQLTGNPLLAAVGPDIPVTIRPVGNADINYGQEFSAAGINQINHKVWLDMSFHIQIACPLLSEVLTAQQDFMLVDRLLSGTVPPTYVTVPGT